MMKTKSLFLRVYGERESGQWSVICLDFNLAAQADTLEEAQAKLHSMIKSYVNDAMAADGPDRGHAKDFLLHRRAPIRFWIKFYIFNIFSRLRGKNGDDGRVAGSDTLPLIASGA